MPYDDKTIEDPERDRWQDEKVDRRDSVGMVAQKRAPALRRRPRVAAHTPSKSRLSDLEAELEQFTMNVWGAPERVRPAHLANERAQLSRDLRLVVGTGKLALRNFPNLPPVDHNVRTIRGVGYADARGLRPPFVASTPTTGNTYLGPLYVNTTSAGPRGNRCEATGWRLAIRLSARGASPLEKTKGPSG